MKDYAIAFLKGAAFGLLSVLSVAIPVVILLTVFHAQS